MLKLLSSTPPDEFNRGHCGSYYYNPSPNMTITIHDILSSDELRISAFPSRADWAACEDDDSDDEQELGNPPFWFSFEEPEHVKEIIALYSKYLKIDVEAEGRVRQGKPFIGCIKRTWVKSKDPEAFRTLDRIYIGRREDVAPGKTLPLEKKIYVITKWDEDGLPTKFVRCASKKKQNIWKNKRLEHTSFLYCMPKLLAKAPTADKRLLYLPTDNFFASDQKYPLSNARACWTIYDDILLKCDLEREDDDEEGDSSLFI